MTIPETASTMGAFEVYFMGILIFSKKKCANWPNVVRVAAKCVKVYQSYTSGSDMGAFETLSA